RVRAGGKKRRSQGKGELPLRDRDREAAAGRSSKTGAASWPDAQQPGIIAGSQPCSDRGMGAAGTEKQRRGATGRTSGAGGASRCGICRGGGEDLVMQVDKFQKFHDGIAGVMGFYGKSISRFALDV